MRGPAERQNLLVTSRPVKGTLADVQRLCKVYLLDDLGPSELDRVVPVIDCMLVPNWWPESLNAQRVARMKRLRFIQSGWAGVNHIPFGQLPGSVTVSSNAGGFSDGVAEFAIALLLSAAKRVVPLDEALKSGSFDPDRWGEFVKGIVDLRGRTLGILGFGGIGRRVAGIGEALGMKVVAFSRHGDERVRVLRGRAGLLRVLRSSDAVVISLPLSKLTAGIVDAQALSVMREGAILVNIARAEIVDEKALYRHMVAHPGFTYATDVWLMEDGKETYSSKFPFLKLPNFIGTPHVAGGSTARTGNPGKIAAENLERFLRGKTPENVVRRSEYS